SVNVRIAYLQTKKTPFSASPNLPNPQLSSQLPQRLLGSPVPAPGPLLGLVLLPRPAGLRPARQRTRPLSCHKVEVDDVREIAVAIGMRPSWHSIRRVDTGPKAVQVLRRQRLTLACDPVR